MPQANRVRVIILPRIVVGALLVLLGVALTLDQLGVVAVHHVWRYWPAALILVGLAGLQRSEGRKLVTPLILIVVGTWLLLNTLGLVRLDIWDFFWPLILVAVGARIMLRRNEPINTQDEPLGMPPTAPPGAPLGGRPGGSGTPGAASGFDPSPGSAPGFEHPGFERSGIERPPGFESSPPRPASSGFQSPAASSGAAPSGAGGLGSGAGGGDAEHASLFALLGSSKRRWGRFPFRSAETTAMLGGCELDLRDALLGSTGTAVVEVFVFMGGVEILVPPNWSVSLEVAPVLGGAEDSTRTVPSLPAQKLIVRGTVVMGGVEISN
jgi:hypothetical protein